MKLIEPKYNIVMLENCGAELSGMIEFYMHEISRACGREKKWMVEEFIGQLNRILFQIIFTLAIIKDDYPGFLHGDFFVRNILLSYELPMEKGELKEGWYTTSDYVAYHYKQKIFYLEANGPYAKINDFGLSVIVNELEPSTYQFDKMLHSVNHKNPFNQKTDIFNLLHDIYDGQNLGTYSINKWAVELKIPVHIIKPIKSFIEKFLDVNVIDKININNSPLLDDTWDIDGIRLLEDIVLAPDRYLTKEYFSAFQEYPRGGRIVRRFNQF